MNKHAAVRSRHNALQHLAQIYINKEQIRNSVLPKREAWLETGW
jgi:hypothetical protein